MDLEAKLTDILAGLYIVRRELNLHNREFKR